ncbi:MAG: dTDP-4-dehydrorhamnose reductase [Patescibacteria group bacterium]|jgi:dTDP-4-dehydrorhamnose reductase
MRIALFGTNGLLGGYLEKVFSDADVFTWASDDVDIRDVEAVREQCSATTPDIIINAAAYNAVDEAERSAEASEQAFSLNSKAVHGLAEVAASLGAVLIHFSTDYVFDGKKGDEYNEDDIPNPLSVYGRSKREGEEILIKAGERGLSYYLVRTSRLFGLSGRNKKAKRSFPDLVLTRAAETNSLSFIDGSEISSPTYAADLAAAVRGLVVNRPPSGIYHRTNQGSCSWYDFAKAVLDNSEHYTTNEAIKGKKYIELLPVAAADVPRPAPRPKFSALTSIRLPLLRPWQDALIEYLSAAEHDKLAS